MDEVEVGARAGGREARMDAVEVGAVARAGAGSRCDRDAIEVRTSHLADVVEGAVQVHVGLHVHDDHARLAVGALGRLDVPGEGEGWG